MGRRLLSRGAAFLTGRAFMIDDRHEPCPPLGFACLNEQEHRLAVDRLAAALPDARAVCRLLPSRALQERRVEDSCWEVEGCLFRSASDVCF